jgi:hypothetical protein
MDRRVSREGTMAGLLFTLGMGCFVGGLLISGGILAWQILHWLKFGFSPDIPILYAFDYFQIRYPVVAWVGAQRIINEVLRWPLSLGIFGVGVLVGWFFIFLGKDAERDEMRSKNKARVGKNRA